MEHGCSRTTYIICKLDQSAIFNDLLSNKCSILKCVKNSRLFQNFYVIVVFSTSHKGKETRKQGQSFSVYSSIKKN